MVEERQSSTLAAHRSVAYARKPDSVVVGVGRVFGHNAEGLVDTVVMDEADIGLADVLDIGLVLDLEDVDLSADSEQSAGKEPLGEVVVVA